ncbi:cytochrome P450 [Sistotremastrum niveocremeum HHB9708]|uniref:Cytochrome P450 n=1 Tax=Sistotremastrum niveocremeum HHB9708 TaxID=1314777 RepID=A0A164SZY6_9AGAM|nr:cytochrome P450 [Sistotremastrum niveocremeum HHB9708]
MLSLSLTLWALAIASVVWRIFEIRSAYKRIGHIPGFITTFGPMSIIGSTLPHTWWNAGLSFPWHDRDVYKRHQSEVISIIPLLWGAPVIYISSIEVAKQMMATNAAFGKPPEASRAIEILGPNIVSADGETWKRQRRIAAPAFNQKSYQLVWEETKRSFLQMIDHENWGDKDVVTIPDFNTYTRKIALFVISACGFGMPLDWSEPAQNERGEWSNREIITQVSLNIITKFIAPAWAYKLIPSKHLKKVDHAYKSIESLLNRLISSRGDEVKKRRAADEDLDDTVRDVFGRLVQAQLQGSSNPKMSLSDTEIVGNAFLMLFAGHETTAHSMAATLAFLALDTNEQDKLLAHIQEVVPEGKDLVFEDYDKLEGVLACLYEAIRLFPAGYILFRDAREDVVFTFPSIKSPGQDDAYHIKKGTSTIVDMVGLCYNDRLYPEPLKYMPSRWYGNTDRIFAFSTGPRTCLGMKFATTEAVCFLTHLLRDWRVELNLKDGETPAQWKEKYMKADFGITLTLSKVPLKFVKRK